MSALALPSYIFFLSPSVISMCVKWDIGCENNVTKATEIPEVIHVHPFSFLGKSRHSTRLNQKNGY
jgi:hypothetical protein